MVMKMNTRKKMAGGAAVFVALAAMVAVFDAFGNFLCELYGCMCNLLKIMLCAVIHVL